MLIIDIISFAFASIIFSVGLLSFAAPNNITPGGATGIATLLNYLWDFPIGLSVLIINIPLIIIARKILGPEFIKKTCVCIVIISITLDIVSPFLPKYEGNTLLASIYGGLITGIALAIFFSRGATSGGTNIIVLLLQKKYPFLSTGRFILIIDMIIVIISAFVYKNIENVLYALIFIFISSRVLDEILFGRASGSILTIITTKEKDISEEITNNFSRGLTILEVKGGYTKEKKSMLYCAVRKSQVAPIIKVIKKIDQNAFVVISQASEIIGFFKK